MNDKTVMERKVIHPYFGSSPCNNIRSIYEHIFCGTVLLVFPFEEQYVCNFSHHFLIGIKVNLTNETTKKNGRPKGWTGS